MTLLDYTQTSISVLRLPVRIYNILERNQIDSVEKLLDYSIDDLLEFKGFGKRSKKQLLECLKVFLNERGITVELKNFYE